MYVIRFHDILIDAPDGGGRWQGHQILSTWQERTRLLCMDVSTQT
jgi:hypothetical protein